MKQKFVGEFRSYLIMTIGLLMYSFGVTAFLIPSKIIGGGVTGIATVIYFVTGIKTGYAYFLINSLLILMAIRSLGASFGVKTLYGLTMMSLFLSLMQQFITTSIVDDIFLNTILGGLLCGLGLGIVFNEGGSSGGTDIIAMMVNKYRNISPGKVILLCDVVIIGSSYFVFKTLDKMVYGYVSMWVVSYAIDAYLNGAKQSIQMFIFSEKYEELADFINHETNRGLTVFDGTGWYTKRNVKMIMTVVRKREAAPIFRKIKEIDPNAFISQNSVMGVYGDGFDVLKY
ncbi:YitT family protein [Prolixibacteraceae bacterium]|nr:YitT family protein [Prolixibacteraceae bacterium]